VLHTIIINSPNQAIASMPSAPGVAHIMILVKASRLLVALPCWATVAGQTALAHSGAGAAHIASTRAGVAVHLSLLGM
jgi:hypothetical protein